MKRFDAADVISENPALAGFFIARSGAIYRATLAGAP
jgi:hypothetical protein